MFPSGRGNGPRSGLVVTLNTLPKLLKYWVVWAVHPRPIGP